MKRNFVKNFILPFVRVYWRVVKPSTEGSRALIIKDSKILLVKDIGSERWKFSGGGKRKNEDPEACLLREIKEELNMSGVIRSKRGTFFSQTEGKRDTIHLFLFEPIDTTFKKQWEIVDAQWFFLNDIPLDATPATKRRIEEYNNGINPVMMAEW